MKEYRKHTTLERDLQSGKVNYVPKMRAPQMEKCIGLSLIMIWNPVGKPHLRSVTNRALPNMTYCMRRSITEADKSNLLNLTESIATIKECEAHFLHIETGSQMTLRYSSLSTGYDDHEHVICDIHLSLEFG